MQKLDLDFAAPSVRGERMDDETRDLIIRLASRVGMIMEDASPVALTLRARTEGEIPVAIRALTEASAEIAVLLSAMNILPANPQRRLKL